MKLNELFKMVRREQPNKSEKPTHWIKCDSCGAIMYYKEVVAQQYVCPKCGFHMKISAQERIDMIADEGTFIEFDRNLEPTDPLHFVDSKSYRKRIEEGRNKTSRASSAISGECRLNGHNIQLIVFDFSFMGGSLGSVEGEKIFRSINRAIQNKNPLIIVNSSGGARMQESTYSLMQMAKTSAALTKLSEAKIPYISILTDPTMGGVSASFAMLGDMIIAEPGALIGFAGARVIKQTIGAELPEGFQRAEFLLEHGQIDMIVERKELKNKLSLLMEYMDCGLEAENSGDYQEI